MKHLNSVRLGALLAAAALASSPATAQTPANSNVTVVVNGSPVAFDQPPVEQAGRVYVPLRGVFERLGASVVFANGTINATAGRHVVSLQLGSANAIVDGHPALLDSPPLLIGGRALVPLRFVSQALGATVNYNDGTETAYVNSRGPMVQAGPVLPPGPPPALFAVLRAWPNDGAVVEQARPEISATFSAPVFPDSVRVMVDGRDVTAATYVSDRSFSFEPAYDLPPGPHNVVVRGRMGIGPFRHGWSFVSQVPPESNFISRLRPSNGSRVGGTFVVNGMTRPGSVVRMVAVSDASILNFVDVRTGGSVDTVTSDGSGYFAGRMSAGPIVGGVIDVRIESKAPDGGVAIRTLRLRG